MSVDLIVIIIFFKIKPTKAYNYEEVAESLQIIDDRRLITSSTKNIPNIVLNFAFENCN